MVDGTAPHTIDPKLPFVSGEQVVDLSKFVKKDFSKKEIDDYRQANLSKKGLYLDAYKILGAIEKLYDIINKYTISKNFEKNLICEANRIINLISNEKISEYARVQNLFLEAYTTSGYVSFVKDNIMDKKVINIIGVNQFELSKLLEIVALGIDKTKYNLIKSHNSLNSKLLDYLILDSFAIGHFESRENVILDINFEKNVYNVDLDKIYGQITNLESLLFEILSKTKEEHFRIENIIKKKVNWLEYEKYTNKIIEDLI